MDLTKIEVGLLVAGFLIVLRLLTRRSKPSLPPSPNGLPIIGNLLDMPTQFEWLVFSKWGEQLGDLFSLSVLGTNIIVINSYPRAVEMLDKRSNVYSDRPYVPMAMELMEMKDSMGFLPYDKRWKAGRRMFHKELGSIAAIRDFFPQEEQLGRRFLKRLLTQPEKFLDHCLQHAGAVILRVAYGYDIEESNDPFVHIANKAMDNFNRATAPGAFLVNQLPILLYVPDWFPGAGFKKLGKLWAKDYWAMVDVPHNYVKEQLANGSAEDSFTAKWLKQNISHQDELDLKFASSSMFGAGAETTAVIIQTFFLLMAMYPEIQKRAQDEVDSVVGRDRLPTFQDRTQLPYVDAISKEIMRFHPPVPLGLPHCTANDDIHDGYFIPKGSLIFANVWNMTHDPSVYKNPMEFDPTRFLGPEPEQDPYDTVFGFGRRLCPGRLLGDASIYITLAMTLSGFDIASVPGEPPLRLDNKTGIVSHLKPFKVQIKPRMEKLMDLVR